MFSNNVVERESALVLFNSTNRSHRFPPRHLLRTRGTRVQIYNKEGLTRYDKILLTRSYRGGILWTNNFDVNLKDVGENFQSPPSLPRSLLSCLPPGEKGVRGKDLSKFS